MGKIEADQNPARPYQEQCSKEAAGSSKDAVEPIR